MGVTRGQKITHTHAKDKCDRRSLLGRWAGGVYPAPHDHRPALETAPRLPREDDSRGLATTLEMCGVAGQWGVVTACASLFPMLCLVSLGSAAAGRLLFLCKAGRIAMPRDGSRSGLAHLGTCDPGIVVSSLAPSRGFLPATCQRGRRAFGADEVAIEATDTWRQHTRRSWKPEVGGKMRTGPWNTLLESKVRFLWALLERNGPRVSRRFALSRSCDPARKCPILPPAEAGDFKCGWFPLDRTAL